MLKPVKTAIFLSVAISAFNVTSVYANEWFEQQRSASDGDTYSAQEAAPAGVHGRPGPVSASANYRQSWSWLDRQLRASDGSPQSGAEIESQRESAYQGASLQRYPNDNFAEAGRLISDGM